jgi:hypothetical protein
MLRRAFPWVIMALVVIGAFVAVKHLVHPDPAYWVSRADYLAAVKAAAEQHQLDVTAITADEAVIKAKTEEIARILANAGKPSPAEVAKDKTIAALHAKVAALESQGDLAGALAAAKAESVAWSEKFTLAEARHAADLTALNASWTVKYKAKADESDKWQTEWLRSEGLRKTCDELRAKLEKDQGKVPVVKYSGWAMEATVSTWAVVKHKDFTPLAICAGREALVWLVGKL